MDYDDDYEDYSQDEGFDEDALTNEEYDQLHEALPKLRNQLASYNDEVPEYDLKEALYANYWDIEASLTEIKSRFKKSKYTFFPSQLTTFGSVGLFAVGDDTHRLLLLSPSPCAKIFLGRLVVET